jgi:hydrogenase maturation protease
MKALIAGFGNIFFHDDGYGVEAARALALETLPAEAYVCDFGIRGMHLAFEMIEGYDLVVFLDAVRRDGVPGTLYVIEPENTGGDAPDAHAMELHNVLAFYDSLCEQLQPPPQRPRMFIVGCEPQSTDEGIGLSDAVADAVTATGAVVRSVLAENGIGAQRV